LRKAAQTLPYLDRTFDVVVIPSTAQERAPEARRVAASALICIPNDSQADLEIEWKISPAEERASARTSIIIPVFNKVSYTEGCLNQLRRTLPHNFNGEIIVVDDASSDDTPKMLEQWSKTDDRFKFVRNPVNSGFIASCNLGAEKAAGEVLVFLNNDTLPMSGWLPPLLRVLRDKPDAGAVGGKLVYPNGVLQEAGAVIFSDGSGCNFGKNDKAPNAPLYSFVREVDYCSGALLATPRALFLELGGFDTRFAPAYYEDADYCFRLREKGYRVYYQPESVIVHFEGVSSGTDITTGVKSYQAANRVKFVEKWSHVLKHHSSPPERYDFATLSRLSARSNSRNAHED
jgi:GT2 family glycosyltransferase